MSSLPDEHSDFVVRQQKFHADRLARLRFLKGQAETVSELIADPRWEIYGRQIEMKRKTHGGELAALKTKLENAFLNPQDYGETKVKQAYNQGCCDGLDFALQIAKDLIEQGEKALGEIEILSNQVK